MNEMRVSLLEKMPLKIQKVEPPAVNEETIVQIYSMQKYKVV